MKRKNIITISIFLLLSSVFVKADEPVLEWGDGFPVEIYACDYREGSSPERDTKAFVKDWGEWAQQNGFSKYVAALMSQLSSDGQYPSQFQWIGYWDSYASGGADMQARLENGEEMFKKASKFLDNCNHAEFGAWSPRPIEGDWVMRRHISEWQNCKYLEGKDDADLLKANAKYASYLNSIGDETAIVQLWPRAGGPVFNEMTGQISTPWDFKWIQAYPSLKEYSAYTHKMWNEGLGAKYLEIYGGIMSCDSSRVYDERVVYTPSK